MNATNEIKKVKWLLLSDQIISSMDIICKSDPKESFYNIRKNDELIVYLADQSAKNIIKQIVEAEKDGHYPCVVFHDRKMHQELLWGLKEVFGKFGYMFWAEQKSDIVLAMSYPDDEIVEAWITVLEGSADDSNVTNIMPLPVPDKKYLDALTDWRERHLCFPKTGPYEYIQELMEKRIFKTSEFSKTTDDALWVHNKLPWLCYNAKESTALGLLNKLPKIPEVITKIIQEINHSDIKNYRLAAADKDIKNSDNPVFYYEISDGITLRIEFRYLNYYRRHNTFVMQLSLPEGSFDLVKALNFQLFTEGEDSIRIFDSRLHSEECADDEEIKGYEIKMYRSNIAKEQIKDVVQKIKSRKIVALIEE